MATEDIDITDEDLDISEEDLEALEDPPEPEEEKPVTLAGPPVARESVEKGGQRFLLFVICTLIIGLAIPLLAFFFIKSPQAEEQVLLFGVSYHKLVFVLLLSSAVMVYASLFFLKLKPTAILVLFCLMLFSCYPFILGLKKDLTLGQVILDIPIFANWPILVNPGYVLIEFVIPLGVLIYLLLQAKNLATRRPTSYAYLCVAVYLSAAAFLGLSGLAQAGQPTIGSVVAGFANTDSAQPSGETGYRNVPPDFPYPAAPSPLEAAATVPAASPVVDSVIEMPPVPAPKAEGIDGKFLNLSEKMDGMQLQLNTLEKFLLNLQADRGSGAQDVVADTGSDPPGDKETIVKIQAEMKRLSERIDLISDTFNNLALLLNTRAGGAEESQVGTGTADTPVGDRTDSSLD